MGIHLTLTHFYLLFYFIHSFSQSISYNNFFSQSSIKVLVIDDENQTELKIYFLKIKSQTDWNQKSKRLLLC